MLFSVLVNDQLSQFFYLWRAGSIVRLLKLTQDCNKESKISTKVHRIVQQRDADAFLPRSHP
jgi:hypothetical protein